MLAARSFFPYAVGRTGYTLPALNNIRIRTAHGRAGVTSVPPVAGNRSRGVERPLQHEVAIRNSTPDGAGRLR